MATSAKRMRALRERQRRGLRRLTIEVSEDDLRAIAKRGYEGAVTTDHDQQTQAVGLLLSDSLTARTCRAGLAMTRTLSACRHVLNQSSRLVLHNRVGQYDRF